MFSTELNYFIANQDELVKKHRGKVLVIKGKRLLGVYPTALKEYLATKADHEPGSFMLQPCEPGPDAYTVTIASSLSLTPLSARV